MVIGNLTRDPEYKQTQTGKSVCTAGIAINRDYKDASGEKKQETCFMNVDAWGTLADIVNQYVRKGDLIFVEGRLTSKSWLDKDGNNRTSVDITAENIQLLKTKGDNKCETAKTPTEEKVMTAQEANLDV
jgi:single-strand DNA-binding protein